MTAEQADAAWAQELASRKDPAANVVASIEEPKVEVAEPVVELSPVEKRLAALEATNTQLKTELGRTTGRVSSLQSTLDAAKAAKAAAGDGPSTAQIAAATEDPEEWKQLMADFPDWGVAFEKKMDAKISASLRALPKNEAAPVDVESLVEQRIAQREVARVDRKHPTWRDTVKTPEYAAWKEKQAPEIRALEDSDYAEDAIEMLNLFEGSKATDKTVDLTQRRKAALESASVNGKPRQQSGAVKAASDLTAAEAWELEKQRRARARMG
jgi:hypothetical protein